MGKQDYSDFTAVNEKQSEEWVPTLRWLVPDAAIAHPVAYKYSRGVLFIVIYY